MTKEEEAIKYIKNVLNGRKDKRGKTEIDIALEMSIEALEKVGKALSLIKSLGLRDEIMTVDDVLDEMKNYTLFELANTFSEVSNLLCELRDLLESDEVKL